MHSQYPAVLCQNRPIRTLCMEGMQCPACLVTVHGQPLLKCQLEPVAAGDAVAGVVVEVLVAHDACRHAQKGCPTCP